MDSVAVNGIRYEVVKATKQEFVETWGCDEDDCPITNTASVWKRLALNVVMRSHLSMVRRFTSISVMASVSLLLSSKRSSVSLLKSATKFRQPFRWLFGIQQVKGEMQNGKQLQQLHQEDH